MKERHKKALEKVAKGQVREPGDSYCGVLHLATPHPVLHNVGKRLQHPNGTFSRAVQKPPMTSHIVRHFKKDCISCGACAAIAPDYWELDEQGMAELKGSRQVDGHQELDIDSEEALAIHQEAANCCPVNIIKVEKKEAEVSVEKKE